MIEEIEKSPIRQFVYNGKTYTFWEVPSDENIVENYVDADPKDSIRFRYTVEKIS